ncbi:MAG: glycoside hydrolase family 38 C-terminal domain-containing protein [Actinomycetota bacterium]
MHDDRSQVEARIQRALRERIRPAIYPQSMPLDVSAWEVPGEPVPVTDALAAEYVPFAIGSRWGTPWSTTWLRISGCVPAEFAGKRLEVVVDLGFGTDHPGFQAEGLAYDMNGRPIKGISPRNAYVPIEARAGDRIDLLVEAAANPTVLASDGGQSDFRPTKVGELATAGTDPIYTLRRVDLAVRDVEVFHLTLDIEVLDELMRELPANEPRRHEILRALERALDSLDLQDVATGATAARKQLADALARPAHATAHRVSAVGHAHIDSAWLWPIRETMRKCARTFSNVVALADDYPELVFACSSAQQYAWVQQQQPEIFARIKAAVARGQWAPVGGMWVESDANLPGGEALARQLIHGRRYFKEEFDFDCQEVWLPDSFGYTAAFPQLARLAGARWFLTQKLSWNQTNKLPHHTFWWEGIDGTRVFTHFPPVDTYNARVTGSELAHATHNYADKGGGTRSLMPFGYGDGGGGPTREMLERTRRLADVEGSARVTVETPTAFFAAAEAEYADAPVWSGELYLEIHRGTYTTQAKTKSGNRRSEHLLREAELWAATAAVRGEMEYPYEGLDRTWKTVLLHQFHDILPGSSIGWVHREAAATYAVVAAELEELIERSTASVKAGPAPDTNDFVVMNSAPHRRREVLLVSSENSPKVAGKYAQILSDGRTALLVDVPALGTAAVTGPEPAMPVVVTVSEDTIALDNGLIRCTLDANGLMTSVYDVRCGREALPRGAMANLLQLHPDHPNQWDAWDIDAHYRRVRVDLVTATSVEVVERGPLFASVRIERSFGTSTITQIVSLTAGSARLDVDNDIDWHETEKVLKVAFPLDIHAERSSAEIQFGHVQRPTHSNTSWDAARFEIWAHRWLHVADSDYGFAVVNDSTYGHDVARSASEGGGTTTTVRLTLLRAAQFPDPTADQGRHHLRFGLVVGASIGDAVEHGYAVNLPLRVVPGPPAMPLLTVDNAAVAVESLKLAEDRSGDVVVRLYESRGGRALTRVRPNFAVRGVTVVDLLEDELRESDLAPISRVEGSDVLLELRPFQVVTLRFGVGS